MAGGNSVSFGKAAVTAPARARRSNEVRELCSELRERFCHATRVGFESAFESADSRCFDDVQADHGILENTKKAPCILWRCVANECS